MSLVLETRGLCLSFGGIRALVDLDLEVHQGEVLGVIGPNGAGKTVLLNLITRFYKATGGQILFGARDLTDVDPVEIGRLGIARTFQNIRLFKRMTALENVLVAGDGSGGSAALGLFRRTRREDIERARSLLEIMRVAHLADRSAGALPYGDARRVELARALALRPRVLLLDEPAAGMNEEEKKALRDDVRTVSTMVDAIVLVEHDMAFVRSLATRIAALVAGVKVGDGPVDAVLAQRELADAYLGAD
jgi:branched-chain amino acid transport system ATP-binding protein